MAPSPYCCPCAFSKLHPQQKSWSLPTQMRTETRSKFEFPIGRSEVRATPGPSFGACTLAGFTVITEEIVGQTWTWHRLFHSPGCMPLCVPHNVDRIRMGTPKAHSRNVSDP